MGRLLQDLRYGVRATDPAIYILAPLGMIAVAVLAGFLPALRASRLDPLTTLRHE
jgi:macrolide transport system ATP-binding/permease protein